MFRRATVSVPQRLKLANLTTPELLQFHHPVLNRLRLVRNKCTRIGNPGNVYILNSMEGVNVPSEAIAPIQDINPQNSRVIIRARVTNKEDVQTWSNSRGEGKLFRMDLLDNSGQIRMIAFNNLVDLFYDLIEVNQIYYISRFSVKPADKQFTRIKHDYQLFFNNGTQVIPCVEDTSNIPQVAYDFVIIPHIEHVDADKIIDVIGVCKTVADCQNVTLNVTGQEVKKRALVLIDQSGKEIGLTIWGKTAEEFCDHTKPIVAVKGVKVSDYGGKSLSCLSSSVFQVNPDLEQAHALRRWYDTEGFKVI